MPMGFDLGSAFAKIEIDSSGVASGMNKAKSAISNGMAGIGSAISAVTTGFAVVGGAALAFGALAVKSASDSQQAVSQLNAVLKSTGGAAGITEKAATDLASSLQKVTRYSDETVLGAESMLLTFTNIGKTVFPEATATVLDMSTALGQDLKSSSIQLGKALNDPIAGITALSRVGVTFTKTQKDMIKSLVDAGKVEQAQKVILAELAKEFGGSAVAAGQTFAGQIDRLKNRIDDFMETIGNKLLPIVTTALEGITKGLGTFFDAIGDGVDPLEALGMAIFSVFGEQSRGIVTILKQIGDFVELFVGTMQAGVEPITAFAAALVDIFGPGMIPVATFLLNARDAINTFLDGVRTLIGVIGNFGNIVQSSGIVTAIMSIINAFGIMFGLVENDTMSPFLEDLTNKINAFILGVQTFVQNNPAFIVAMGAIAAVLGVAAVVAAVLPPIIALITGAVGLLTGALGILLSPAVLLIAAITGIIYAASQLYPGGLVKLFKDATTAAQQLAFLGMYALAAASDFAKARLAELLNTILAVIGKVLELKNALTQGVTGLGGIIGGVTSGQFSIQQVLNAIGSEIGHADGGAVQAGMRYTVGERGAETFIAPANGAIVPNNQGGGQGLSIGTVVINANTEAGGRAAAKGFKEELENAYRGRGN